MAKRCSVCGRGSTSGAQRSHSNRQSLKRQNINLQTRKMDNKTVKVCVNCLKTAKKNSAPKKVAPKKTVKK
jgi:ribosomal protein L28